MACLWYNGDMYTPKHMKSPESFSQDQGATEWDMSDVAEYQPRHLSNKDRQGDDSAEYQPRHLDDKERQERKIISALAYGSDGHIKASVLEAPDVEPPKSAWDKVLDGLADGSIPASQKYELISSVAAPTQHENGPAEVDSSLDNIRERRILGFMSAGVEGYQNVQSVGSENVSDFVSRYPTPIEFDRQSKPFLDLIERDNGPEKRKMYESAMESFKHKVYGEQYEYWQRLQELEAAASARQSTKSGESQRATSDTVNPAFPDVAGKAEIERSSEWVAGAKGFQQLSRGQVERGFSQEDMYKAGLWADEKCEDALLIDAENALFGVFDGAGGESGGGSASRLAVDEIKRLSSDSKYPLNSGNALADILNRTNDLIAESNSAGYTTAVLTKLIDGSIRDGQGRLAYASVGDSRMYIVSRDGEVRQVTRDEGHDHVLTNALGIARKGSESRARQYGEIPIRDGDRLVLCTDGITGDVGDELMSAEEIGDIVQKAYNPQNAATALTAQARKKDDRTVFVTQFVLE